MFVRKRHSHFGRTDIETVSKTGKGIPTCSLIGKSQSLVCLKKANGTVVVDTPNRQVRQYFKELDPKVPTSLELNKFMKETIKIGVAVKGT
jgi:hypothetical protein